MSALLRKIFDVPKPRMKRPGASSCTTRASIATCTGWRVNGEMIPQAIVSFDVCSAISADTTVDERASIWCLRHHGYASARKIVSKPVSSSSRAVASISATGSMVSCITPMRNGGTRRSSHFGCGPSTDMRRAGRAARSSSPPLSFDSVAEAVPPPGRHGRRRCQEEHPGERRRQHGAPVERVACRPRSSRGAAVAAEDVGVERDAVRAVVAGETLAAKQDRLRRRIDAGRGRRDAAAAAAAAVENHRRSDRHEREGRSDDQTDEGQTLHRFFLSSRPSFAVAYEHDDRGPAARFRSGCTPATRRLASPRVEFRILGPLEVDGAAGPIDLSGGKQRALLAILLLHANEVVASARPMEALGSDGAPADAAKALQIHVSRLRRALAPEDVVQTRPGGYVVAADADALDLPRFEQLIARGRSLLAASNAAAAREVLVDALALWRGPPLAGLAAGPFPP